MSVTIKFSNTDLVCLIGKIPQRSGARYLVTELRQGEYQCSESITPGLTQVYAQFFTLPNGVVHVLLYTSQVTISGSKVTWFTEIPQHLLPGSITLDYNPVTAIDYYNGKPIPVIREVYASYIDKWCLNPKDLVIYHGQARHSTPASKTPYVLLPNGSTTSAQAGTVDNPYIDHTIYLPRIVAERYYFKKTLNQVNSTRQYILFQEQIQNISCYPVALLQGYLTKADKKTANRHLAHVGLSATDFTKAEQEILASITKPLRRLSYIEKSVVKFFDTKTCKHVLITDKGSFTTLNTQELMHELAPQFYGVTMPGAYIDTLIALGEGLDTAKKLDKL